ncbi:MAG: MogA/MoaB family molybdenum cofactor biosynthesis protein [Candidatus Tectomicrobia bacterium]|nr:MogA/MoaB family molybdenum cofactor biosynthesis protein [Candidatus Tectomicrobia bacterium]
MGLEEHRQSAPTSIKVMIVTVSDTRTPETDTSGQLIRELLRSAGHEITGYEIVKDEPALLRRVVERGVASPNVQVMLFNGGTGIAKRDTTFETLDALLEKRLPGFGDLFRQLSYAEIGAAAMLSRAAAGVVGGTIIVSTPGSRNAVRLAMEKLILPELGHLVGEVNK